MMNDKANIRFIDTHSEGDSGDNNQDFIVHPTFLNVLFFIFGNISMIVGCFETFLVEFETDFFAFFS